MKLIGLAGLKQSGKDTVCDLLKQILHPTCIVKIAFAERLYDELAEATGFPVSFIKDHKDVFRTGLQWWGTDLRRNINGPDYWINKWHDRVWSLPDKLVHIVITPDVRFRNEAQTIHYNGGLVFRIRRWETNKDPHPSETELTDDNYPYNDTINNTGTLEDLENRVRELCSKHGLFHTIATQ